MVLTKESYNEFFIDKEGRINVRRSDVILEDGVEIAKQYHRRVFEPIDDISAETDTRLKAIAAAVWTEEVKQAARERRDQAAAHMEEMMKGMGQGR